jgi:putative RNA 2'-phosphotransferase
MEAPEERRHGLYSSEQGGFPRLAARHQLSGSRIRALYGHSTPGRIAKAIMEPPEVLYHGTDSTAATSILAGGLKPMQRQYVHLSKDPATAREVGSRKEAYPVILVVRASEAHRRGVAFYQGNDSVWLADFVPPEFIARSMGE